MNERQRETIRFLRMIPNSDLYEGAMPGNTKLGSGKFYISYAQGKAPVLSESEVNELIHAGHIKLKWPEAPDARCYVLTK